MGKVGVLLLTLAAGQRRWVGGLGVMGVNSMRVAVLVGIKKSRLRGGFQRHRSVHIVIVGPDGADLVKRQHRVHLHFREGGGSAPGEQRRGWKPGQERSAPKAHGTSDIPETQRKRKQLQSEAAGLSGSR